MKNIPLLIQKMTTAVLETKGHTEPALRQAVRQWVEHMVNGQTGDPNKSGGFLLKNGYFGASIPG